MTDIKLATLDDYADAAPKQTLQELHKFYRRACAGRDMQLLKFEQLSNQGSMFAATRRLIRAAIQQSLADQIKATIQYLEKTHGKIEELD